MLLKRISCQSLEGIIVLLVEDNESNQLVATEILNEAGILCTSLKTNKRSTGLKKTPYLI